MKDPDASVRLVAAEALLDIDGSRQAGALAPVLAELLKSGTDEQRRAAAMALVRVSPKPDDLAPGLVTALKDPDGLTRLRAAEALGGFPSHADEATDVLVQALGDPSLRYQAIEALTRIGPTARRSALALVSQLEKSGGGMAFDLPAALALARVDGPAAVQPLMRLIVEGDPQVRLSSVQALAAAGPAAIESLASLVKNEDPRVRGAALRALAKLSTGRTEALPALREALKSDDPDLRFIAVEALGRLGPGPDAERLTGLLPDPEPAIAVEAAAALARSPGESAGPAVAVLLAAADDRYHSERLRAIEALGALGPLAAPAVSTLTRAAGEEGLVHTRAIAALGRIGPAARSPYPSSAGPSSVPTRSPAPARRSPSGRSINKPNTPSQALIEAIESPVLRTGLSGPGESPYAQGMSMNGMGSRFSTSRSGRPVPVEDVREVRREALSTLGRMGSKARDAATALADAAREVDEPTRRAALDALKAVEPVSTGSDGETEPGASTRTSPSDPDPRG